MRVIIGLVSFMLLLATGAGAQDPSASKPTEAERKAIDQIRRAGGLVLELAQNDPHLEVSYLQSDGKLAEQQLIVLKDLKHLVHLNLRGQPITDAQLVHLRDLTGLTELHLEKTKITDKGLENLKGLVNLEYLNLYGTDVSDAGLANLENMKKLKRLYLWQTKVTEAGAAKLKKALPKAEINRGIEADKPKELKKADTSKADDKKKQ
jgi:Leucine-rich repeat (LRR) protein